LLVSPVAVAEKYANVAPIIDTNNINADKIVRTSIDLLFLFFICALYSYIFLLYQIIKNNTIIFPKKNNLNDCFKSQ
jgi:Sec-independent protein secretion pathway component TatC